MPVSEGVPLFTLGLFMGLSPFLHPFSTCFDHFGDILMQFGTISTALVLFQSILDAFVQNPPVYSFSLLLSATFPVSVAEIRCAAALRPRRVLYSLYYIQKSAFASIVLLSI